MTYTGHMERVNEGEGTQQGTRHARVQRLQNEHARPSVICSGDVTCGLLQRWLGLEVLPTSLSRTGSREVPGSVNDKLLG